ncbi:hypothetical protein KAJ89_04405 [Candidatus Parcubacteria bacterium]|nr:hypothetical protein [Candidatus Parcubacteria bacterium]
MAKCFLCEKENQSTIITNNSDNMIYKVECVNCGEYKITDMLLKTMDEEGKEATIWFVKSGATELITCDNIGHIIQEYKIFKQAQ